MTQIYLGKSAEGLRHVLVGTSSEKAQTVQALRFLCSGDSARAVAMDILLHDGFHNMCMAGDRAILPIRVGKGQPLTILETTSVCEPAGVCDCACVCMSIYMGVCVCVCVCIYI